MQKNNPGYDIESYGEDDNDVYFIEVKGIKHLEDVEKLTINAMKSAFIHYNERLHYIYNIIKPGFQKVRDKLLSFNNSTEKNEKTIPKL